MIHSNDAAPDSWFRPMPDWDFDSLQGMAELKRTLREELRCHTDSVLRQLLPGQPSPGYFFYGPPGTGKSRTAGAFARGFMEQGYRLLAADASEFRRCFAGEGEKLLARLFQTAADSAPCVLVIRDLDQVCHTRSGSAAFYQLHLTTAFLTAFRQLQDSGKDVVFIGETSAPWDVDPALPDWLRLVRFSYPDDGTRARYLAARLHPIRLEGELTPEELADAAVNSSFPYMDRLAGSLRSQMLCGTDPADLEDLISGRSCPTRAMLEQALAECPPRNNSENLRKLDAFEAYDRS